MPRQHQPYLPQIRHHISQNQRIVVLQIQFDRRAQIRTLGKHCQILELKNPLNDLCRSSQLLDLDPRLRLR